MRRAPAAVLLALAGFACPAARAETLVNIEVGLRNLDDRFWSDLDGQTTLGVDVAHRDPRWPAHLVVGLHFSDDEQTEVEFPIFFFPFPVTRTVAKGTVRELSVGVDKIWSKKRSKTRPFLGGGAALVRASIDAGDLGLHDSDTSPGAWAHGGVLWVSEPDFVGPAFQWGFELRVMSGTSIEFGGARGDADYVQLGLIGGFLF